jgi:hypothetical protein
MQEKAVATAKHGRVLTISSVSCTAVLTGLADCRGRAAYGTQAGQQPSAHSQDGESVDTGDYSSSVAVVSDR